HRLPPRRGARRDRLRRGDQGPRALPGAARAPRRVRAVRHRHPRLDVLGGDPGGRRERGPRRAPVRSSRPISASRPRGPSRAVPARGSAWGGDRRPSDRKTNVATTNDIKNGTVLRLDGQLWTVIEFQHVKPGKGGAFVRTKIKNVMTGKTIDKTFNAGL